MTIEYAFPISNRRLQIFRRGLKKDRTQNLIQRFNYYLDTDEELTASRLSFVPEMYDHFWAVVTIAEPGQLPTFSYSVGMFYEYRLPELVLLHEKGIPEDVAAVRINDLCCHMRDKKEALPIAQDLSELVDSETPIHFETYTSDHASKFPYGYGDFFYRHFADRPRPPILVAQLNR